MYRAEQKYIPFFGTGRNFQKKSIAQKHLQSDATLRSGFLSRKTRDGPVFWIFPGFTDKG